MPSTLKLVGEQSYDGNISIRSGQRANEVAKADEMTTKLVEYQYG
jgi:hypothetical protein